MVLQKRLDYGFSGYQVPPTPRATRSARRRSSFKRKVEENQMCAFNLLATVAGKLLLEGESSPTSSNASTEKDKCAIDQSAIKQEQEAEKLLKVEPFDQGICDKRFVVSELVSQDYSSKEFPHPQNDCHSGFASLITTSDCSEKFGTEKLVIDNRKNEMGSFSGNIELGSSMYREPSDCKLNSEIKKQIKDELLKVGGMGIGTGADTCSADDRVVWDEKPPALVSSDSSAKVPLCSDHVSHDSFLPNRDEVNVVSRNVVSRDDDENSSGCTHPSTTTKFFRSPSRIGDRRLRKLLASKYWKQSPKLKDEELLKTDGNLKQSYRNRKNSYKRLRSPRNYPFKKRKFFDCSSVSNSDERISSEGIIYLPEKSNSGDASGLGLKMHGGKGTSISVAGQHPSFQSKDSHVKLRIKSFRVPELFIEIPETATVGSLKRTVLEAVTAILGNGLRVGVLLQGKKVRDDNKTLLQTGISHDNQLDTLGFTLEPSLLQTSAPLSPGDSFMIPCDTPQPLKRYPPTPTIVHQEITDASHEPHVTNLGNSVESDHDSVPSPTDRNMTDCKALVAVPAISVEALAIVPMHRKSKRSEIVQRRIRRPFSVAEVEALVQAVEKLGTGRWRDVKLRAFDNAKHRTYVDLKDKWKTLVHTARISPQQRRGEPVPQELLDRVLTAHAYWSQQQARQQLKQQQSETCLL